MCTVKEPVNNFIMAKIHQCGLCSVKSEPEHMVLLILCSSGSPLDGITALVDLNPVFVVGGCLVCFILPCLVWPSPCLYATHVGCRTAIHILVIN